MSGSDTNMSEHHSATTTQSYQTLNEENLPMKERKFTSTFLPDDMVPTMKDKRLTTIVMDKDAASLLELHSTEDKDLQKFCTGSKYIGKWNAVGPAERGIYRFPHGVLYDGQFNHNGEFHGPGALVYPNGHRVDALWNHGKLYSQQILPSNNEAFLTADYCKMPDRRFQVEIESDLRPAPHEYLINSPYPPPRVPEGYYYTDDGYYGPKLRAILSLEDAERVAIAQSTANFESSNIDPERRAKLYQINRSTDSDYELFARLKSSAYEQKMKINSIPTKKKERWIIKNCRRALDKNVGYIPEYYEYWTTGIHADEERLSYLLVNRYGRKSESNFEESKRSLTDFSGRASSFIQKPDSLTHILSNLRTKYSYCLRSYIEYCFIFIAGFPSWSPILEKIQRINSLVKVTSCLRHFHLKSTFCKNTML